ASSGRIEAIDDRPSPVRRITGGHVKRIALAVIAPAHHALDDFARLNLLRRERENCQQSANRNSAAHALLPAARSMLSASFRIPAGIPASNAGPTAAAYSAAFSPSSEKR